MERDDVFIEPRPTVAGRELRPFSLGSLSLCRRLGLTMLTGDKDGDALSEDEKQEQILTFLFIQTEPIKTVLALAKNREALRDAVLEFSLGLPVQAVGETVAAVQEMLDAVGASAYEVLQKPGQISDDPPNC